MNKYQTMLDLQKKKIDLTDTLQKYQNLLDNWVYTYFDRALEYLSLKEGYTIFSEKLEYYFIRESGIYFEFKVQGEILTREIPLSILELPHENFQKWCDVRKLELIKEKEKEDFDLMERLKELDKIKH